MPADLLLGEDKRAVHLDFEHAATRPDELDLDVRELFPDAGFQTGSDGEVVSDSAVFDAQSPGHGSLRCAGCIREP